MCLVMGFIYFVVLVLSDLSIFMFLMKVVMMLCVLVGLKCGMGLWSVVFIVIEVLGRVFVFLFMWNFIMRFEDFGFVGMDVGGGGINGVFGVGGGLGGKGLKVMGVLVVWLVMVLLGSVNLSRMLLILMFWSVILVFFLIFEKLIIML